VVACSPIGPAGRAARDDPRGAGPPPDRVACGLGHWPRTLASDTGLGHRPRTPASDTGLGHRPRTPASDTGLGHRPRTPASDTGLGHCDARGRCPRESPAAREASPFEDGRGILSTCARRACALPLRVSVVSTQRAGRGRGMTPLTCTRPWARQGQPGGVSQGRRRGRRAGPGAVLRTASAVASALVDVLWSSEAAAGSPEGSAPRCPGEPGRCAAAIYPPRPRWFSENSRPRFARSRRIGTLRLPWASQQGPVNVAQVLEIRRSRCRCASLRRTRRPLAGTSRCSRNGSGDFVASISPPAPSGVASLVLLGRAPTLSVALGQPGAGIARGGTRD
jgi:hypothetical protein